MHGHDIITEVETMQNIPPSSWSYQESSYAPDVSKEEHDVDKHEEVADQDGDDLGPTLSLYLILNGTLQGDCVWMGRVTWHKVQSHMTSGRTIHPAVPAHIIEYATHLHAIIHTTCTYFILEVLMGYI